MQYNLIRDNHDNAEHMTFCGPARDMTLSNRKTETLTLNL